MFDLKFKDVEAIVHSKNTFLSLFTHLTFCILWNTKMNLLEEFPSCCFPWMWI